MLSRWPGPGEGLGVPYPEAPQPGRPGRSTCGRHGPRCSVNYFYFYCVDADFGPFFVKFCSYFPYTAKLCVNANNWAQRQAEKAGIAFTPMDNAFAAVGDVPGVAGDLRFPGRGARSRALLAKWLRILPHPFTEEDIAAGYRYDVSIAAGGVLPDADAGPGRSPAGSSWSR